MTLKEIEKEAKKNPKAKTALKLLKDSRFGRNDNRKKGKGSRK